MVGVVSAPNIFMRCSQYIHTPSTLQTKIVCDGGQP